MGGVTTSQAPQPATTTTSPAAPQPSEFIARAFTEGLGRLPTTTNWKNWRNFFGKQGCRPESLRSFTQQLLGSKEFADLPYDNRLRVVAMYRAVLSREPDQAGLAFWKARLDAGSSMSAIVESFASGNEFNQIVLKACNASKPNYPFTGTPFKLGPMVSGATVQQQIDAAAPGTTVYLDASALIQLKTTLVVKPGVTLATRASDGVSGRRAYLRMARIVPVQDIAPALVMVMKGAHVRNVWIDGRMWQYGTRVAIGEEDKEEAQNNVILTPSATMNSIRWIRSDSPRAGGNIVSRLKEPPVPVGVRDPSQYASARACDEFGEISENLVINSANVQLSGKWADGISASCAKVRIERNEILDASDVPIIIFRTGGLLEQQSKVRNNLILNAGNSAFGGLVADPLSFFASSPPLPNGDPDTSQGVRYPECATRRQVGRIHCDFTGTEFTDNTLWTGEYTHFVFGISNGTRAWAFFDNDKGNESIDGKGAMFSNNSSNGARLRVGTTAVVSGMHHAIMDRNFDTPGVVVIKKGAAYGARGCPSSMQQIINKQYAQNITFTPGSAPSSVDIASNTALNPDDCVEGEPRG